MSKIGTHIKIGNIFASPTARMKDGTSLKAQAEILRKVENDAQGISNYAQILKKYAKEVAKMIQNTDAITDTKKRAIKIKQEEKFINDKVKPAMAKYSEAFKELSNSLDKTSNFKDFDDNNFKGTIMPLWFGDRYKAGKEPKKDQPDN